MTKPQLQYIPDFGKIPPQAIDIEQLVLGSILATPESFDEVAVILKEEAFYKATHQIIYRHIVQNAKSNKPVDVFSVMDAMRESGTLEDVGGAVYLTDLTSKIVSSASIAHHASIVKEKYIRREVIRIASKASGLAFEESADEVVNYLESALFELTGENMISEPRQLFEIYEELSDYLEKLSRREIKLTGVPAGILPLDRITLGWQQGDLIIIAARPSVGKCLGINTKVIMYDGSVKNVQDIVTGDKLMGDDSTPRNVLSTTVGRGMMYWVRQSKAMDYRVNKEHILSLRHYDDYKKKIEFIDIPLNEYVQKSNKWKTHTHGYFNQIPIKYNKQITLDPYYVGLFVGDGVRSSKTISCNKNDVEIINYLEDFAKINSTELIFTNIQKHSFNVGFKDKENLGKELERLGLLDKKHIPKEYLLSNITNRYKLLAGLLDSDGYVLSGNRKCFSIGMKDGSIIKDIQLLARSLALSCSKVKRRDRLDPRTNKVYTCYEIIIGGSLHLVPTKLKRKQIQYHPLKNEVLLSTLTIEEDKVDNYYGFELDGNGRFLLEDYTVTHNTALALQLTRSAALLGKKVLFFSLEMSERQLATRLLSGATAIDSQQLRRAHDLPWEKIHETILENYNKNIFIDDKSGQSVFTMRSTIRKYKRKYDIDLVVIDYLQLAQGDERFIKFLPKYYGSIATTLKNTAKDVDIPIILLSQLNRAVEDRSSHIPKLSDLKESGDIEQDADVVLFPLRYIQFKEFHDDPKYGNIQDKGQIDIAKHRNGPTGRVYVSISDDVTRWTEWDRDFKINTQ